MRSVLGHKFLTKIYTILTFRSHSFGRESRSSRERYWKPGEKEEKEREREREREKEGEREINLAYYEHEISLRLRIYDKAR